jgi:hypothetical protein
MMTIGTLTCIPSPDFSFKRSYIGQVSISGILGLPVMFGDYWYFPHPVLPNEDYHLVWRQNFLDWSSNRWTLDYVVKEYYHTFTGDPTHYPVDFSLRFFPQTATALSNILNVPFGVSTPPNFFGLDSAPPSYWLPT